MNLTEVMLQGTLQPDGTLVLDDKPNLPAGRVQVVVRAVGQMSTAQSESLLDFVNRVRRESEARRHRFMTEQEIAVWMEELRADDDQVEQAYRQAEAARHKHE
jgi:hypothetical protein